MGNSRVTMTYILPVVFALLAHSNGLSEFTDVTVFKTVEMVNATALPNIFRFNVSMYQWNASYSANVNLTLTDGSRDFKVYWGDNFEGPSLSDRNFKIIDDAIMEWKYNNFSGYDFLSLSYKATFTDDGENMDEGIKYYNASVSYILTNDNASYPEGPEYVSISSCLDIQGEEVSSLFLDYGFTVLALVCGFLVGVAIMILILFIITQVRRKTPFSDQVHPYNGIERADANFNKSALKNGGYNVHGTLNNTKAAASAAYEKCKKGAQTVINASIVAILSINDKLTMLRRMDEEDINQTMKMEKDLENERCASMMNGTSMLVESLKKTGDIDKGVADKCTSDLEKKMNEMEKNGDQELKNDLESMLKNLSKRQKSKVEQLKEKQDEDVVRTRGETNNLSPVEQKEIMNLLHKQHDTEMDELMYTLKLEQDEVIEQARNDQIIKNRVRQKELQQEYLKDVENQGNLSPEQLAWLMQEYYKQQSAIDKLYDEEKQRARMLLEEKIARRRALAEKHEVEEEGESDVLNTIAMQQIGMIQTAKKGGVLSASEAKAMSKEYQEQMMKVKEKMDAEKERQKRELDKKLSERKKNAMEQLSKKHQQDLNELNKKHSAQMADASCDPMNIIESKQTMISLQRSEMIDTENQMDIEHVKELTTLEEELTNKTKDELLVEKDKLSKRLEEEGLSEAKLQKLLEKHGEELQELEEQLAEDKKKQMANFSKKLAQHRAAMAEQRELDKIEQDQLRDQEESIVRKIMDNQVSLSEEERNKIMKEHDMLMVKLDNGLTLSKLKQKKLLEEKIAKKRATQMEKLQKKQNIELKKQRRNNDDDSEDDDHQAELVLLKKQAEDRMKIMQGDDLEVENELAEIQEAMMAERSNAMKDQEVKLAAMITNLQMEKANEMAKIEEQEKAIHALKANLMDDLNDKGALSDPECQRVIQIHQEEQEKLREKLDSQRSKQEKQLRRRLQERLQQKEDQISRMQDAEMRSASHGQSFGDKVRKAAMMTRHMMEMEKFRNQMEKEINQTLEELRRTSEMKKKNAVQDQELQFLNGLVRLGKFNKAELENVVQMLLPTKSDEELKVIMEKLLEGYKEPANAGENRGEHTTLEDRVLATTISQIDEDALNESMRATGGSLRGSKKLKSRKSLPPLRKGSVRPEPPGRYSPDGYDSDPHDVRRGSKLPPIGSKKSKKKSQALSYEM